MALTVCFEIQCRAHLTLFRLPIPQPHAYINFITHKTTPITATDLCPVFTALGLCESDVDDWEVFMAYFRISACVLGDGVEASLLTLGIMTSLNSGQALVFLLPFHLCRRGCA